MTGFLHDPPGMRKKPQSIDWVGISLLTITLRRSSTSSRKVGRRTISDTLIIRPRSWRGSLAGMCGGLYTERHR